MWRYEQETISTKWCTISDTEQDGGGASAEHMLRIDSSGSQFTKQAVLWSIVVSLVLHDREIIVLVGTLALQSTLFFLFSLLRLLLRGFFFLGCLWCWRRITIVLSKGCDYLQSHFQIFFFRLGSFGGQLDTPAR